MKTSLIVFDMDGVLVDVSGSYREAVRKTARLFFAGDAGFDQLPDPLFPLDDLTRLKESGGLNNDWDLTAQALSLLCLQVEATPAAPAGPGNPRDGLTPRLDVRGLASYLRATPLPLSDLLKRHGRPTHPWVADCYRGDVGSGNVIKRLFQEIYLGQELFLAVYRLDPRYWLAQGLIATERPLVDRPTLERLAAEHLLAIATGRPKVEADYPLDHFALRGYFRQIFTLDDCLAQEKKDRCPDGAGRSLSKPDPFMLDSIGRALAGQFQDCFYVGDMPDDMLAASTSRTGFQGVGVVFPSPDAQERRKALLQAGARYLMTDFADLAAIVTARTHQDAPAGG